MKRRDWKRVRPNSLLAALRLNKEYALEHHHMSVERIGDRMGQTHDAVYKWLATGRMPAILIPSYEHACGCHFVSQWLASAAGKLVIDVPTGRTAGATDIHALQEQAHEAIGALMRFYDGKQDIDTTLAAVAACLEGFAWHDHNVRKHAQPELELA